MKPNAIHKRTPTAPSVQPRHRTLRFPRSQREVLLELLRWAARRDAWLTLDEMAGKTKFPQASISAQLRHLRKPQYGGWTIKRRLRKADGLSLVWEYRLGS